MFKCIRTSRPKVVVPVGAPRSIFKKSDVDQYAAQKFNIGQNGFIENDITLVSRCTSLEQLKRISARLQEVPKLNPDNSKKSVLQIKSEILDRYSQSPSELVRAQQVLLKSLEKPDVKPDGSADGSSAVPADGSPAAPADGSAE